MIVEDNWQISIVLNQMLDQAAFSSRRVIRMYSEMAETRSSALDLAS
jgi:hypothetical protein